MESELILLCIRLLYNIQIGFAAFFVLMVFIYHFIEQNSIIARFTTQSIKIEKYAGIVYVLIFGTYALVLFTLPSESSNTDRKLLFSQYWYGFWLYPTVIGLLTLVSWF